MFTDMATRKYQKKRRAEREGETRQRIVEAMVALHREVGPARTTISAIAGRAGVERLTVYRHFPDERSMFEACTSHYATQVPGPDPSSWAGIDEPAERLRAALLAFYDYYRRAEDVLTHATRDVPQLPALAAVLTPWQELVGGVREELLERWVAAEPGGGRLAAAIAHALRFETWRSLARAETLTDDEAADLMVTFARAAANDRVCGEQIVSRPDSGNS
jgi:AcrR family transcriptional regulator